MSELALMNNDISIKSKWSPIVFISDLHFDYKNRKRKFKAKAALHIKDDFIMYVKEHYTDSILCVAGDLFNDHKKTLQFVKELEINRIVGFFVLGNHDFWNDGTKSHMDIISSFEAETQGNQYFRFLFTGRKYYINDLCFIGDTGWTSFQRGNRRVALKQFMKLPDAAKVKDFDPEKIIAMHKEWVSFANGVLDQEEKVIIVTHFPMVDFTQEDEDCWWSSQTDLGSENSWRIFGHTHKCKEQQNNNVSSQRGYDNGASKDSQFTGFRQYSPEDFGILKKIIDNRSLAVEDYYQIISKFYSPLLVSNAIGDSGLLSSIKMRGYKRCSANKVNFAYLANKPEIYLERVKQVTNGYLGDTYIGYHLSGHIPESIIESIFSSIAILKNGNSNDIRAFITAAVITGYVFNGMIFLLASMRPLDDYDIMRFWLMFLTMKQYKIGIGSIDTVRTNRKNHIEFCNVELYLPAVNGLSLAIDEVQKLIQQTPLLPRRIALLYQENDQNYVKKRTPLVRYDFTFIYMNVSYGIYKDRTERLFYVSEDVDRNCHLIYNLTMADNSPNTLLLKKRRHKSLFDNLINEYRWGHVRFESVQVKDIFMEIIKMYDSYRNGG